MVIRNCTSNVSFGPRTYAAPGSNGETYTVTQFHDETWTCTCAHFEKRIRHPVPVKYGCKHMRNAENGEYGKPRCRVQHRPVKPRYPAYYDAPDVDCPRCGWGPIGCNEDETGCKAQRPPARRARTSTGTRDLQDSLDV